MQNRRSSLFAAIAAGKFTYLLVSMGLLLILSPFLSGIVWAELATDIIYSALFFAAVYAVTREGPLFILEVVLALLTFVFRWWYHVTLDPNIGLLATATGVVFFVLIAISIIAFVLGSATRVTAHTISGSICAYLLIGVAWAHIFAFLQALNPETLNNVLSQRGVTDLEPFLYFSFVTLTTLGYGDIVPGTPPAHFLAAFEAITGQLYLTVLVARLVALYGSFHTIQDGH